MIFTRPLIISPDTPPYIHFVVVSFRLQTNPTTEQPSNPEGGDTEPTATAEVTTEPTAPADESSGNEDEAGSPESSGLRKAISSVADTVALLVAGVLMM